MSLLKRNKQQGGEDLVSLSTRGQRWGQPGRCPQCGGRGYLDRIDLVSRELYQHCAMCEHHWITLESDLDR